VRIAFLTYGVTAYQDAAFRALAELGDELLVVQPATMTDAPFDPDQFTQKVQRWTWPTAQAPDAPVMVPLVEEFRPDAVMMVSWSGKGYRAVMKAQQGRALRILFTSNIWRPTAKQWLGRLTHRIYLDPLYDCAFVPGDRSEWFARRLGFDGETIIRGANTADVQVFERGPRDPAELAARKSFLFTGRLVDHKGVAVLAEAYRRYRRAVDDPWFLDIVGTGPLADELSSIEGVRMHGFRQPPEMADAMHEASALILPSFLDWYGVVVHEAAVSGLPLILSDGVGAVPHLLQDGFNGWTVAAGSVQSLTDAMVRMSTAGTERLGEMSRGSQALGKRLSPEIWARNVHEEVVRRVPRVRAGV